MDATALIFFLGHSSIHPQFDEFLLSFGIKKRPKKLESLNWVSDEAAGFSLEFSAVESFDEKSLVPRKSEGRLILSRVIIYGSFQGALPHGISLTQPAEDIVKILGNPLDEEKFSGVGSATFLKYEVLITMSWRKKSKESFIGFSIPNIYDKKNYNLQL